jgi:hypothetical protein
MGDTVRAHVQALQQAPCRGNQEVKKMKSIGIPNKMRFVGEGVKFERIRRITGC